MKASDKKVAEGILFTDQYQLTMAQLYFRQGIHERPAKFDHYFRDYPDYGQLQAGFCVNAGLEWLLDWMREARFDRRDLALLRRHRSPAGNPVFHRDFLDWLGRHGDFSGLSMQAIPEGRVVHPNTPLTVVTGPLAMAQILETALLNQLNFQTLVATKAARIREAGRRGLFMEFGARRAQERGAIAGARAALIGGVDFTSNVGVSHLLGFEPKGTHAHSMVQTFIALGMTEIDAFRAYAEVYPDACLLLVDTIDTLESGVPNAIRVFEELKRRGHTPVGVRIDSGDLAYLSIHVAKMLDDAGFPDTSITLSNELDEMTLWQIITQIMEDGPRYGVDPDRLIGRLAYGVGTRLITSYGSPALGGVYKLGSLWNDGRWVPAIKISESRSKTPNPGAKQVWRIYDRRGAATADLICLEGELPRRLKRIRLRHPIDEHRQRSLSAADVQSCEPLLENVLEEGRLVYDLPSIESMRERRESDLERLDAGVKRLMNPHIYHVSLSQRLWTLKQKLIAQVSAGRGDG